MRILDQYIFREFLAPFAFGIAAFSCVIVGTSTLPQIAKLVTAYGVAIDVVIKLFMYKIPGVIVLTLPMATLLGTLLCFGRLSASGEMTAMKSSGLSFYRIIVVIVITAFFITLFSIISKEVAVLPAQNMYNAALGQLQKNSVPQSQKHIVLQLDQRLLYAQEFDRKTSTMNHVIMQTLDKENNVVQIETADKAVWQGNHWAMYDGTINDIMTETKANRVMEYKERVMPINNSPAEVASRQKKPDAMTIKELKNQVRFLKTAQASILDYELELHQRVAIPMSCLVFAFIGAPFGLQSQRSSSSIGLGLSIIIIFVYYVVMSFTAALAQGGAMPVSLAAWIPNGIGILVAFWLVYRSL